MKTSWNFAIGLLLLIIFTSRPSLAAELIMPEAFDLLAINGQKVSAGLFSGKRNHKLRNGINKIVVRYEVVFEGDDYDDFDVIRSEPILLSFYSGTDQDILLQYPQQRDASAARGYIDSPIITLVTTAGEKISLHRTILESSSDAVLLARTALDAPRALDLSPKAVQSSTDKQNMPQPEALQMLKYWWSQASEKQKKAFRKHIEG